VEKSIIDISIIEKHRVLNLNPNKIISLPSKVSIVGDMMKLMSDYSAVVKNFGLNQYKMLETLATWGYVFKKFDYLVQTGLLYKEGYQSIFQECQIVK
jgi:hypothetical protein